MRTSMKFKGCEFRFRPHFTHLEFEVTGAEGHASGRLTANDCLELGKFFMDAYYARAIKPESGTTGEGESTDIPTE
jgi:hypothetical protein